jgi:hypothetical protein
MPLQFPNLDSDRSALRAEAEALESQRVQREAASKAREKQLQERLEQETEAARERHEREISEVCCCA